MRSVSRYLPRKYRATLFRILLPLFGFIFLCLMFSSDQSTTGMGRSDESLFQFEYDQDITDAKDDDLQEYINADDKLQQPVAPIQLRDVDLDAEADLEADGNFTEEALLKPDNVEYFTPEELKPWFEKSLPNPADPGEYGKPVRIPTDDKNIQAQIKAGWDKHAFNHYVCEKISLHRFIGDKRDQACKDRKWRKPLPTTSVIIIFHNEAWCALLRTVHSVLESSPKVALKEIILVDDASTFDELKGKLDEYVKSLLIVRIVRLRERAGLIRARLAGAEAAQGDVLTFLDSHCECAPFWLEPLLERIAEDPTRVVCPVIEVIDADTFALSVTSARHVPLGAFGWGLEFRWATQPGNKGMEIQKKERDEPFSTPVMAGAAFSIQKEQFYHLGAYDKDMDGRGSENLELSFRVWMCGGTVEINPCSRVGHIGRKRKPYATDEEGEAVIKNKMIVAETWMDSYKWMFYRRTPKALEMDVPDVTKQKELKEELGCGNFEWYLTNIYTDLYIVPFQDIVLHGEIRCTNDDTFCLDSNNIHGNPGSVIDVRKCSGLGKGQYYEVTEQGEIRQNTISELCLAARGSEVWTEKCRHPWHDVPESQKWIILPDGHIYHPEENLCLTANIKKLSVHLLKCVKQSTEQLWILGEKEDFDEEKHNIGQDFYQGFFNVTTNSTT